MDIKSFLFVLTSASSSSSSSITVLLFGWKPATLRPFCFLSWNNFHWTKCFRFNNVCSWRRKWNYYTEGIIKAPNLLSLLSTVRFCSFCFICLFGFFFFLKSRGISLCQWLKNTKKCRDCGAPNLKHTLFEFFNFLTRVVKFPRKLQSFCCWCCCCSCNGYDIWIYPDTRCPYLFHSFNKNKINETVKHRDAYRGKLDYRNSNSIEFSLHDSNA